MNGSGLTGLAEDAGQAGAGRLAPEGRFPGPVVGPAAARVLAAWPARALDAGEVAEHLASLCQAIHSPGERGSAAADSGATAVHRRRLLDLLRAEVLRGWSESATPPEPSAMLDLLCGFERVREALDSERGRDLASHLAGPDGLELVVEVGHAFRSRLTPLICLADMLRSGQAGGLNEIQRRQLGLMSGAAVGLSSLATNVMELARGSRPLVGSEASAFSVAEVLESVLAIVRPIAEERGLVLQAQSPAADQRLGYPLALGRILENLVTALLEFADGGAIQLCVRELDPVEVEFSVRGTECVLDAELLPDLFRPFHRTEGQRRFRFSDTGLRFAVARMLVEAMGSELVLERADGSATRWSFELRLPLPDSR